MGKNQSASGLTNIIQYDNNGNVSFVSGSTTLMQISSSGAITTTGVISGSNALSASFSLNSGLLNGTGSVGFATTASLLTVSSSQQQISASQQQISSSFLILTASFNAVSASQQQISSSQQQISASLLNVIAVYATTGSNSFRATQSITGSLTVTGQIIAQTLNVQQVTSSIIYSSGSNNFGCDLNSRQTFTGSVNITGSQNIFGNVGIGLNNATNRLEVQSGDIKLNAGASRCTNIFFGLTGTNYGKIQYSDIDGSMLITTIGSGAGYDLNLGTQCTTRLTILGDGKVGIGTGTPLSAFHANCCVAGGATTTVARFGVQDSTGYGTTSPAIELTGTNIGLCFTIGKIAGINDVSSGGSMAFSTGLCAGTVIERMRITSCGNVGIGTNCPLRKLHILNNDDTRGILIHNCSTTSYAELHFCASREFRIGTGGTAADSPACNKFYIYDATSSAHRFTIDCTGRIGIGTATPSELLHVCGNIRAGNIDNSTNFAGTSPYIGIGGSTPLFLVHSSGYGVGYFGYDTGGDRLIIATDNGGGNNKIDFSVNAGTSTDGSANNVSGIAYAMRIDGSGRVSMPYQPAFKAGLSTSTSVGANSTIIFNDTSGNHFNIGGHYSTSTGMFTAPVAGRYIFSTVIIYQSISAGQAMDDAFYIYKNSSLVAYSFRRAEYEAGYTGNAGYYVDHANILLNLAASDTVSIRNNRALDVHGNTHYTYFYGYMLG